jgi:hypothetical protein
MTDSVNAALPVYGLALILLLGLALEAFLKRRTKRWSMPALAIYTTTFIWYFVEILYTPQVYRKFSQEIIEDCYFQVIIFLMSFRLCLPWISHIFLKKLKSVSGMAILKPDRLLMYVSLIWAVLLLYGIVRMNGDIQGALFPLQSRAGTQMWGRAAAAAGATGFLVSAASYLYQLVCALFGILLTLQTKPVTRFFNGCLFLTCLPYYVFMGSRNQLLAVVFPAYFTYILFSKHKALTKVLISTLLILSLSQILGLIIDYRNIGFSTLVNPSINQMGVLPVEKQIGLNMLEELSYINRFYQQGTLEISYGGRYFAELVNVIPRTLWPNKPLLGVDYAILRGYGDSSRDAGVFATLSTGFIGQGVVNFGPWLGAIAPGVLMAMWAAFLSRLWAQRLSTLRLCLFLTALGVTFNLGRDITLLVLFPIVFGYVLIRCLEATQTKRQAPAIAVNPPYSSSR